MGYARASVSAGLWGFCWLGRCRREIGRVYVVRLPRMGVLSSAALVIRFVGSCVLTSSR